jgi:hypothetical protein
LSATSIGTRRPDVRAVGDGETRLHLDRHRRNALDRAEQPGQGVERVDAHVGQRAAADGEELARVGGVAGPRRHPAIAAAEGGVDRPDRPLGEQAAGQDELGEQEHRRGADEDEAAPPGLVAEALGRGQVARDGFLAVDVLARLERGQGRLGVGLDRGEVDDGVDLRLRQHLAEVGVPGGDAVPRRDLARPRLPLAADGDQLGAVRDPVELGQVVPLGDVAGAEQGEFQAVVRRHRTLTPDPSPAHRGRGA